MTRPQAVPTVQINDDRVIVTEWRFAAGAVEASKASDKLAAKLSFAGDIEGFESLDAAMAAESGENIEDAEFGSTMLYTSGTTGRPKGMFRKRSAPPPRLSCCETGKRPT